LTFCKLELRQNLVVIIDFPPIRIIGDMMKADNLEAQESRTVTRADLAEAVYRRVGLSRAESAELVEVVLQEICDTVEQGETVKLSSFGSFIVRDKGERIGRNPKTGVEVPICPRRVMVFKPSNILKARINGQTVDDE
jgi:integration host factor subunit alpha